MRRGGLWRSLFCLFVLVPMIWGTAAFAAELIVPSAEYPYIQDAIDAAAPGDTIIVGDGTYPGNLLVQKAITIQSENGAEKTTIDCAGASRGVTFSGDEASGAVLSGFTITGGNGQGHGDWPGFGGAVLFLDNACATMTDCIISGNTESIFGGVVSCIGSSPVIRRCIIENNIASYGGGLLCYLSSSPIVIGSTIKNNQADLGAGVYLDTEASPSFISCLIAGNSAANGGGALAMINNCFPCLAYCTVSDNTLSEAGYYGGGGIFSYYECSTSITNSIVWGNEAAVGPEIYLFSSSIAIDHSDVRAGVEGEYIYTDGASEVQWGQGNIDQDPLFVAEGDYHLSPDSPCIDAGIALDELSSKPQGDLFEFDIEGEPRVMGSAPDMGADEFTVEEDEVIQVEIDIKPGCSQNKINLKSWGLLPVAVKTTKEFNARDIDPSTVEFAGARPVWRICYDVDRDRDKDMLFFFWIKKLNLDEDSSDAILTGKTKDGKDFKGKDVVSIEKPKCKAKGWRFGRR